MKTLDRVILLWLITIIGMILHFNYHIGEIFYGVDIVEENATGKTPNSTHIIRGLFYHLPILWILLLLYVKQKWFLWGMFGISILYTFAHGMHLVGELGNPDDISQISLLSLMLIVSILLNAEHFKKALDKRRY